MSHTPDHKETFEKVIQSVTDKKLEILKAIASANPFAAIADKIKEQKPNNG